MKRWLPILLLALLVGYAWAETGPPETLRIRVEPEPSETEASTLYFQPGLLRRRLSIENQTKTTKKLRLYPADASNTAQGALAGREFGQANDGAGSWLTLSDTRLQLEPGEVARVSCEVNLPDNLRNGDHVAFVFVEADEEEAGSSESSESAEPAPAEPTFAVKLKLRYGVPVLIRAPEQLVADFEHQPVQKQYKTGQILLSFPVASKGNLIQRLRSKVTVYSSSDQVLLSKSFDGYLLPDLKLQWELPLTTDSPIPRGDYRVVVESQSDVPRLPDRKVSHTFVQQLSLP